MKELIELCKEKGISIKIENLGWKKRAIGVTFSKNNKYYYKIICYDENIDMNFIGTYLSNLIEEVENELNPLTITVSGFKCEYNKELKGM